MDASGFYHKPSMGEDDGYEVDDYGSSSQRRYFPDTYLDSPILTHKRAKWMAALSLPPPTGKMTRVQHVIEEARRSGANSVDFPTVDPDLYPEHYRYEWPGTITDEWDEAIGIAGGIYSQVRIAMKARSGVNLPDVPKLANKDIIYWLSRWSFFDSLVEEYSKQSTAHGKSVIVINLGTHTRVIATQDMWFLRTKGIGSFAYTYEQILMLKDLMYSRAQCHIAASTFYSDSSDLHRLISEICHWHESCLTRHGNVGFEILKNTEALSKAYLSEMTDHVFGSDGPYPRMLEKVRMKERKEHTQKNFLCDNLDRILRSTTSIKFMVEIFGLLKISGHPLIDPQIGGLSAAGEARAEDQSEFVDCQMIDWEFKRTMLMSYIRKHGSWPPLEFSPEGKKTQLHKKYRRQYRGLNRSSYPLSDWQHCRFGKIVEMDMAPNYLEFLDDKSISLYRSNIAAFWNNDVKPTSHRRLLLELIERKQLVIKDIVTLVMRREIPLDWLIVSCHPKEREFKLAPRMFSMLVLEIRIFFALTEANLADRIFPYLPQQTMTMNKVAIARKFLEITKPVTSQDALRMFIEIDLTRWNLRWRAGAVDPVGRTLNDMFGVVGVFDYCHTFFSSSMVVVRVSDLPPKEITSPSPPESELLWYNHMGGFEGICQKLWTICTYAMISLALNDLPLGYTLLGQGDNQVVSVVTSRKAGIPDNEVLKNLRDVILERIAKQCERVNQEVKPEECLESTTVVTYSKDVYVNGVYYPTTLKFHSRLFPHSSQIFPSVRNNVGAVFSTSVAGGEKSEQPMLSYFLACLHSSLYLIRTMKGRGPFGVQMRNFKKQTNDNGADFVKFMITLPSEAGGFPTVPFVGFTYKGGSDPLGKSLSAMHCLGHNSHDRLFNRMLAQMTDDRIYNPSPDRGALIMDPFSIPIRKPVTSTDGVAAETLSAIRMKIKTEDLKELMSSNTDDYLAKLTSALLECRPFNPLIMRDIRDCSVAGVTDTVSKMFVATRTLQHVVRAMGVPIVDKVLHLESAGLLYMFQRYKTLPVNPAPWSTIFELTTKCRDRWYPGEESPIVGLTTVQPLDFTYKTGKEGLDHEGINAVLVANSDPFETRGPFDPYVGSKTREKRSEHGFKIIGTDSSSRNMRKLQLIGSQTGDDEMFSKILDVVGWSRTNTTLSDFSHLLPGVEGGTLSHRYAARAGHQDAFNIGSPNFATHCCVSTDKTGYLSGGIHDYPIMFQEFLLHSLWCLMTNNLDSPGHFGAYTIITEGSAIAPLPNVDIRGPDKLKLPILRYPGNHLVFIPDLRLEHVSGAIKHPAMPVTDQFVPSTKLRLMTLEAFFRNSLRKHSVGRQIADGAKQHFAGSTLDLAELRSNGLWLTAVAIRNVIVDEAISNFMMTDLNNMNRWVVTTYATKLISPLAASVTPMIGHPMLMEDPTVVRFNLFDKPSYAGGVYSSHDRYCAVIGKLVVKALTGNDPSYNHRQIGVFTSDNSRILSETIMQCFLCDLFVWVKKGIMDKNLVSIALGNQLLPAIRSQHEEKDRVGMMIRAAKNVARLIRDEHPEAGVIAEGLGKNRVTGYKCTIGDMLKSTRDTDKWGILVPAKTPRKTMSLRSGLLPPGDTWSPRKSSEVCSGFRALEASRSPPDAVLTETYYRNLGRLGYYSGSAIHTWSVFGELLARRQLIVIGSGMGAAARVAIDNGAPHVFGLDLRSSLPLKSHRFRSYKPPLVLGSEYHERYTQMHESFTTSGDWTSPEVVSSALSYDAGDSTFLIDIQDAQRRFGLEVLKDLIKVKTHGNIIFRAYLAHDEHVAMCSDLSTSGVVFKSYTMEAAGTFFPVIFVLVSWPRSLVIAIDPQGTLERKPIQIPVSDNVEPFERTVAMSDAVLNVYMPAAHVSPVELRQEICNLVKETKGDYDSRFAYGEWTRMLRAYTSAVFLCLPEDDRMPTLLQWYFAGEVIHDIGEELRVKVDWHLAYHLVSTVSRVC